MPLSPEICQAFFTEVLKSPDPLRLTLPSEGKAIKHRFDLHKWRAENREALPEEFSKIIIRAFPRSPEDNNGPWILEGQIDTDSTDFLQALEESLGRPLEKEKSARELFEESL